MKDKIIKQIMAIRSTGKVNMFDSVNVMRIAQQLNFNELVRFLSEYEAEYIGFIMSGNDENILDMFEEGNQ